MLYESPPMLGGNPKEDIYIIRAYLFRLAEMLNASSAPDALAPGISTAVSQEVERRSFLALLGGGALVPVVAFGGSLAGSATLYDADAGQAVTVMLHGTYPAADRLPEPGDFEGHFFPLGGGYVGTPESLTDTYKVKQIIAI